MRPRLTLLDDQLKTRIIAEARELLCRLGIAIHDRDAVSMLCDHGASFDEAKQRIFFTEDIIDLALSTAPRSFCLYDARGVQTHDFGGSQIHFTPGSSAIRILDNGVMRTPVTADCISFARLVSQLNEIDGQSTALVAGDVPEQISDSYRLFVSLLYCSKPVTTGAFSIDGFEVERDLLVAVRGSENALREKPLALLTCCPTAPLQWNEVSLRNLLDCVRTGIPVEIVPMPLSGFIAPVSLVGTLVQHTAEALSGVVIGQIAAPGARMLYGGSTAIFDIRYETTPMGAVETQMIACAATEIGHALGLPTQAYISLSDAKALDAQAGLETSMGATLAALSGINAVSGPGMLDFESCQSLEKLVLDNEICALVKRLSRGIEVREDFPSLPIFEELLVEKHLLIADHTLQNLNSEIAFPGPVLDRTNISRWQEEGSLTLLERCRDEVDKHLSVEPDDHLDDDTRRELETIMQRAASAAGIKALPDRT